MTWGHIMYVHKDNIKHIYNSNKSPTRCNNFPVYYPDVCLQVNMFQAIFHPSSGAQWLQWQPLVLPSYCGDSCAVFVVGLAWPRTQHNCHHDTKVKPEAATAVIELLMMGGKTPETCWAVNKHQDNKLENCCIWMVTYLNHTMMHRLTNLKHLQLFQTSNMNLIFNYCLLLYIQEVFIMLPTFITYLRENTPSNSSNCAAHSNNGWNGNLLNKEWRNKPQTLLYA
jgi:hypothetical protein